MVWTRSNGEIRKVEITINEIHEIQEINEISEIHEIYEIYEVNEIHEINEIQCPLKGQPPTVQNRPAK